MKPITELAESDLEETFSRASGPGGQNVNKVSTRVVLRHIPTDISVTIQDSRSQAANRQLARERLLAAVQAQAAEKLAVARSEKEKIRRSKAKRPRKAKESILRHKHHQSERKLARRRVED